MIWQKLKSLSLSNFGPFYGSHSIDLPENGLVLLKGLVVETGDGSGAGKSFLLNSIPFVFSKCPFSATELQSWDTDEPPTVAATLDTAEGEYLITRSNGLQIKGGSLSDPLKGKVAVAELDRIFGMDLETRSLVTYRGQRKPGMFLSMSNPDKTSFLSKLLDLGKFEAVEEAAKKTIDKLEKELLVKQSAVDHAATALSDAEDKLRQAPFPENKEELVSKITEKQQLLENVGKDIIKIHKEIEALTKANSSTVEAVISSIRSKMAAINNSGKPVEIVALKAELLKQQNALEDIKKREVEQVMAVQAKRNSIENDIIKLKAEYKQKVASTQAEHLTAVRNIQSEIKALSTAEGVLASLKEEEKRLEASLCPRCQRQWDKAKDDLVTNRAQQAVEQTKLENLEKAKAALIELEKAQQDIIKKIQTAGISELKEMQGALASVKDPEQDPQKGTVQARIAEINNSIINTEKQFEFDKQQKLDLLFQEEKDSRKKLADELGISLADQQQCLKDLQAQGHSLSLEVEALADKVNECKQLEAARGFRQEVVLAADKALKSATAERDALEMKLNLEVDIVALVGKKTGFLGSIFTDVLTEISYQTNDILSRVANVRHLTMEFETEKEAVSTGNITNRIVPVIYNRGRKVSFDAGISGGMQAAVELAVDLAVGNVVSARRAVYPNFLVLDESLHGLGGVAKESCIEMLQSVAGERLVLVVDHSTEFCNLFNQVIEIQQLDGRSRIV